MYVYVEKKSMSSFLRDSHIKNFGENRNEKVYNETNQTSLKILFRTMISHKNYLEVQKNFFV